MHTAVPARHLATDLSADSSAGLPELYSRRSVEVELAVFQAPNRQAGWCWYADDGDWAAGPLFSAPPAHFNNYAWLAAGEALRRFPRSQIRFTTSLTPLAAYLNQNRKYPPRQRKKLSRYQVPVVSHRPREKLSAVLASPDTALEIARTLPTRLIGPSAAFSGGGRVRLDGCETTIFFTDGSAVGAGDDSAAGWAYTDGEAVYSGSLPGANFIDAELTAALEATRSISTPAATLYADCATVVNTISPQPRKERPPKSPLAAALSEAAADHPGLKAVQILGHASVPGNHVVDRAARAARYAISPQEG